MNTQPTEQWSEKDKKSLLKKQLKHKDGTVSISDIVNDDYVNEPSDESKLIYHKPYDQMTKEEKVKLANDRLNFIIQSSYFGGVQPDVTPTTLSDIEQTGALDVWLNKGHQFSLDNIPSDDEIAKQRWEINKDNNLKKMFKTFGKTAAEGFKKSFATWAYMFGRYDAYKPEYDMTGTFWDIISNGYSPIVQDPSKEGKKFTKEYWMNQFAQMGTSVGMAGEMLLEALLLHGIGKVTGFNELANIKKANIVKNSNNIERLQMMRNKAQSLAGKQKYDEAVRVLRTGIGDNAVRTSSALGKAHDYAEGTMIAWKNATLNYQFNVNEEYTRQINHGASEQEAVKNAHEAAWNTFQIEIWGSAAINIAQSRMINSIVRSRFNNAIGIINAAANGERLASSELGKISTKGIVGKNIGRFIGSQLIEGSEEVWEDGMAMWGKQHAYLSNKEKWDQLGLAYYMSEDADNLIDSFIGGVMGGAFLSGARTGFSYLTGKGSIQLQKKQIETYNALADNFQRNINTAAYSFIEENKQLSQLDENYQNKKDIKITRNGEEVTIKASDSNYKSAYEEKRKEISNSVNDRMVMMQTLVNAQTAVKIVMSQLSGNISGAVTGNLKAIENRINAINEIKNSIDSDSFFDSKVENYNREKLLESKIEKLESEKKDATAERQELDNLHAKWANEGITDEMKRLNDIFQVFGDSMKDENGNIVVPDKNTLQKELDLANQQLVVTNVFNNSFYDYVTGVDTNIDGAIKFATNEAVMYMTQMKNITNVDDLLSVMEPMFDSVSNEKGTVFENKRQKVAWAYTMFKKMNSEKQYDNLLQTLLNYMAQDIGVLAKRDKNGVLSTEFDKSFDIDTINSNIELKAIYDEYSQYLRNSEYLSNRMPFISQFGKMSNYRASISLFQRIFDNDSQDELQKLKDYITVNDYNKLVRYMREGQYRKMLKFVDKLFDDFINNRERTGKKLTESINEVNDIKNKISELENKINSLNNIKASDIIEKSYDLSNLENEVKELSQKYNDIINSGKDEKDYTQEENDVIEKYNRLEKELKDKQKALKWAKDTLEKGEMDILSIIDKSNEINEKIKEASPEYNKKIEKEKEKAEKLKKFNDIESGFDNSGENIESYVNSIVKGQLSELLIDNSDISDSDKAELKKKLNSIYKKKTTDIRKKNEALLDLKINLAKKILQPSEVVMSEEEKKAVAIARDSFSMTADVVKNVNDIVQKVIDKNNDIQNEIESLQSQIEDKNEYIAEKEDSLDWKTAKSIKNIVDELQEYDEKFKESQNLEKDDKTIADFEAFFSPKDSRSMHMLDNVMEISLRSRKDIEYMNNMGKENNALLTPWGRLAHECKERLYDIAQMPESTSKEAKRKLKNYVRLYRIFNMRQKRAGKNEMSEQFDTMFYNGKKDIEFAIIDTYNVWESLKNKEEIGDKTKNNIEKRRNSERVSSILEGTLDANELKKFADMDLADFDAVIGKLREIQKNSNDEDRKKIDDVIVQIKIERDKQRGKNLDDIVKEEEISQSSASENAKASDILSVDQMEQHVVYCYQENEEMAKRYVEDQDYFTRVEIINRKQLPFCDDIKLIYKDNNNDIKYLNDNFEEVDVTGKKEDVVIQLEHSIAERVISFSHASGISTDKMYKLIFEKTFGLLKEGQDVSNPLNVAGKTISVNDNGEDVGMTLGEYVSSLTGLDINAAERFITFVICPFYNTKTIDDVIKSVASRFDPKIVDMTQDTYGQMFYSAGMSFFLYNGWDISNYDRKVIDEINSAKIVYQQGGNQNNMEVSRAKDVTDKMQKDYGITPQSTESKYSGNRGLSVHQSFSVSEETAEIKDRNGNDISVKKNVPRYFRISKTDDGKNVMVSLVTEEGLRELNRIYNEKSANIEVENDVAYIYEYNRSIIQTKGENGEKSDVTKFNEEVNGRIGNSKSWNDLSDEEKKIAREIMFAHALIPIKSGDIVIGHLPMLGHYKLNNIRIKTKNYSDRGGKWLLFTDDTVSDAETKVDALNEQVEEFRRAIVFEHSVDNSFNINNEDISISTENSSFVTADIADNTQFGNGKSGDTIIFENDMAYEKSDTGGKVMYLLPGKIAIDTETWKPTYISKSNYKQDAFKLSYSMPNVHYDAKAKLCHFLLQFIADYAMIDEKKAENIITNHKELFDSICNIASVNSINLKNIGSENFDKTKILVTEYFHNKFGSSLIENSNRKKLFDTNKDKRYSDENICKFVFGSLEEKPDGYLQDKEKSVMQSGFCFFLGDGNYYHNRGNHAIAEVDFNNTDGLNNTIEYIIHMMFGEIGSMPNQNNQGDLSINNLDSKLDTIPVRYSTLKNNPENHKLSDFKINRKPENGNIINIENGNFSINTNDPLWTLQQEMQGKVMKQGDTFFFVTGYDDNGNEIGHAFNFAQINIGFGKEASLSMARNVSNSEKNNTDGNFTQKNIDEFNEVMNEVGSEKSKTYSEKPKDEKESVVIPEQNAIPENKTVISASFSHAVHNDSMAFGESAMFEMSKILYARVINLLLAKKKIYDITKKDVELELKNYIDRAKSHHNDITPVAIYTLFSRMDKENKNYVEFANEFYDKHPYFNYNNILSYAEKYFNNELKSDSIIDNDTVRNYLFWERFFSDEVKNSIFGENGHLNNVIIGIFNDTNNTISIDEESDVDINSNEDEDDLENSSTEKFDKNKENTTPMVSTLSEQLRLFLATIEKKMPVRDSDGKIITEGGKYKYENYYEYSILKDLGLPEIYDQKEVINFLCKIGTLNKEHSWDSVRDEIKRFADGKNNYSALAYSLLNALDNVNDERIIQEIMYKMMTREECNYNYLSVNKMQRVDDGGDRYYQITHYTGTSSKSSNPSELLYIISSNVMNAYESYNYIENMSNMTFPDVFGIVNGRIYSTEFRDYVDYYTFNGNSGTAAFNKKFGDYNSSKNIFNILKPFVSNNKWNKTYIDNNYDEYISALENLQSFLQQIYYFKFDLTALEKIGYDNISKILQNIRISTKSDNIYIEEKTKKGNIKIAPALMEWKKNVALMNLCREQVKLGTNINDNVVKDGGKNLMTQTTRSFATWQQIDLKNPDSEIYKFIMSENTAPVGDTVSSWHPQLSKGHVNDVEFIHGYDSISACRYKGDFSGRQTEMTFADQIYVKTLKYFDTTNFNWDYDIHDVLLGKTMTAKARYAIVPDYTVSNKNKSSYWKLLSVIPEINSVYTGNINSGAVSIFSNGHVLFDYVHNALFVSEINRIVKLIKNGNAKHGETLVYSNLTYNKLSFTDGHGDTYTLAEYIAGIDESNKNERLSYLENIIVNSPEARQMTIDIINEKLEDITGVRMEYSGNMYRFSLDDRKASSSLWARTEVLHLDSNGNPDYKTAEFNDQRKNYSRNVNQEKNSSKINDNAKTYYMQAAVDFVFNTLVHDHFIINVLYGGTHNFIESDLEKTKIGVVGEVADMGAYIDKVADIISQRVYKRMTGVMTGGNKCDYSICYVSKGKNKFDSKYSEWGGIKHNKFIYLVCKSLDHTPSVNFEYYARLYDRKSYEKFKSEGYFDVNDYNYYMTNEKSIDNLKKAFPQIKNYLDMDITDGQEFCSWREAVDTMYAKNSITFDEYTWFRNIFENWDSNVKNGNIDKKTRDEIDRILHKGMQVFKPVYFGANVDKDTDGVSGIRTSINYVKSSVCPLFPHMTAGTEYDSMRKAIEKLENERKMNVHLAFDSSIKTGGNVKSKISLDDINRLGDKKTLTDDEWLTFEESSFIADRRYYSLQNETENKLQQKLDDKNRKRREFDEENEKLKLDRREGYYSIGFCISELEERLGIDFEEEGFAKSLIDIFATILTPKIQVENESFQNAKNRAKSMLANYVFKDGKIINNYFEDLYTFMYNNGVRGFKVENIIPLLRNIRNNILYDITDAKRDKKNYNEIKSKSEEEQYKFIIDNLAKANSETSAEDIIVNDRGIRLDRNKIGQYNLLNPSKMDSELHKILDKDYAAALSQEEELENLYYEFAENIEMKTLELTQLEHMLTSNGISKMTQKIFPLSPDVFSKDMMSYLQTIYGKEFFDEELKESWRQKEGKYYVDGITLEKIRNAYEITESYNNMLNLLYDRKNGFGILSKADYNRLVKERDVTGLANILTRKDVQSALQKRLSDEMRKRNPGSNISDLIKEGAPILLNPALTHIENVLMAMVKKNISRTYLTGASFFLTSSVGMKLKVHGDENLNTIDGIIWLDRERGTGPLKAAFTVDKNSKKTLSMAECAIAPHFSYYDKKDKKYKVFNFREETTDDNGKKIYRYLVDENGNNIEVGKDKGKAIFMKKDVIDPEVLKIISLRVPTSGLMNSCAMKIVAFLPGSYSNCIMVPGEHVAQFGEDFDIDKRFCYISNWIVKDGKIRMLTESDVNGFRKRFSSKKYRKDIRRKSVLDSMENKLKANRLINIYMSVLANPNEEVQKLINKTLEWQPLKDTKDSIIGSDLKSASSNGIIRSVGDIRTQTDLCVKSSSGQKGVGAWSNTDVFSSILTKVPEGVIMQDGGNDIKMIIGEGDNSLEFDGNLSDDKTIVPESEKRNKVSRRTKIDVISGQQNINLDTVKEDIIAWINQNPETLPFFMMMSLMGYDLTADIKFRTPLLNDGNINFKKDLVDEKDYNRVDLASYVAYQPIIRRYTEILLERRSIRKKYRKNIDITRQLLTEFGLTKEEITALENNSNFSNNQLDSDLIHFRIKPDGTFEKESKNGIHDYHALNGQVLYQNLHRSAKQLSGDKLTRFQQLLCLSLFTYVKAKGYELQKYRNLVTINSRGIGKTYMNAKDKINALNDLFTKGNNSFKNLSKIIGEFERKKEGSQKPDGYYDIKGCDYYIKPTTAEGNNLVISLLATEVIVGNTIGYSNKAISDMLDRFNELFRDRNIYQENREKMQRRIIHDMQIYLLLKLDEKCKTNGKEGLFRTYNGVGWGDTIELERTRLIRSNYNALSPEEKDRMLKEYGIDNSFYNFFVFILQNMPKGIPSSFISHFTLNYNGTISFNIRANETWEKAAFQNAMLDMWRNENNIPILYKGDHIYTYRGFVKDIIALAYVMDDRQGIDNFKDMIPKEILNEIGIIEAEKEISSEIEGRSDDFERCFNQIVANNADALVLDVEFGKNAYNQYEVADSNAKKIILNPNFNQDDKEENKYVKIFKCKCVGGKIKLFFFKEISKRGNPVYSVRKVEEREGSAKNSYNPYLDFSNDNNSVPETSQKQDNRKNSLEIDISGTNMNTIERLDTLLSTRGKKRDPFVQLLDAVMKSKMFGDFYVDIDFTDQNTLGDSAAKTINVNNSAIQYKILYGDVFLNKSIDDKRMIMREEIMHSLLSGYLYDKFDGNGNIVDKNINKRFEKSFQHFKNLKDYYDRNKNSIPFDKNDRAQLDNIFDTKGGSRMATAFNEFLANIMSGDTSLVKLIKSYNPQQDNSSSKDNWFWDIMNSILDFIINVFEEICSKSAIHKDVATEVMRTLTDIYLVSNEDNESTTMTDKLDMIEKFNQVEGNIKANIGYGKESINRLKTSSKIYKDSVSVTNISHSIFGNPKYKDSTEKVVLPVTGENSTEMVSYTDIGDFIDDMGRKIYGMFIGEYGNRLITSLNRENSKNISYTVKINGKDVTVKRTMKLSDRSIKALALLKSRTMPTGSKKEFAYSDKLSLTSDFTVKVSGNGYDRWEHLSGIPDLLITDNNRNMYIIDFKSFYHGKNESIFDDMYKISPYVSQLTLYERMIHEKLGSDVNTKKIIYEFRYKAHLDNDGTIIVDIDRVEGMNVDNLSDELIQITALPDDNKKLVIEGKSIFADELYSTRLKNYYQDNKNRVFSQSLEKLC